MLDVNIPVVAEANAEYSPMPETPCTPEIVKASLEDNLIIVQAGLSKMDPSSMSVNLGSNATRSDTSTNDPSNDSMAVNNSSSQEMTSTSISDKALRRTSEYQRAGFHVPIRSLAKPITNAPAGHEAKEMQEMARNEAMSGEEKLQSSTNEANSSPVLTVGLHFGSDGANFNNKISGTSADVGQVDVRFVDDSSSTRESVLDISFASNGDDSHESESPLVHPGDPRYEQYV